MNAKIRLLKKLDSLLGPVAVHVVKALFSTPATPGKETATVLFIRPGGIGDALLLFPAIHELKGKFPESSITVLCEKRNYEIFKLCNDIDKILLYDKLSELLSALRGGYDVVIDTEQWYRLSAVIAYLTRAPVRAGFATNERKKLFTSPTEYDEDEYEVNSFLKLLSGLTGQTSFDASVPFLSAPQDLNEKVSSIMGPILSKKIVILFPGGSTKEKRWKPSRFRELALNLEKRGHGIAVVGGKGDAHSGELITRNLENTINLCGRTSLAETSIVLNRAKLLISGDSGIMHMAYALGKPTLALFGPGNYNKWAFKSDMHVIISKNVDCSPCTVFGNTPSCPYNMKCMDMISVDEVYDKTLKMLEGKNRCP